MTKLTLSAEPKVVNMAKRLAAAQNTSVSALFARFVVEMDRIEREAEPGRLGPLTRRALGLVRDSKRSDDELLVEELMEQDRRGT